MIPLAETNYSMISDDELTRKGCGGEQEVLACSICSNDLNEVPFNSSSCDSGIGTSTVSQPQLIPLDNKESNAELSGLSPPSLQEANDRKKYEDIAWTELPSEIREAASRLGYTEDMWDESKEPKISTKYWAELDSKEKEAATVLGYDETQWNFGNKKVTPGEYDDMDWNQLPKNIRKAYRVFGYSKKIWNDDDAPASFDKDWHELTEAEQRAATIIGYCEDTWDEDPEDEQPRSIEEESIDFLRGASYILLECISTAAFSGCIEMIFSVGKRILEKNALNALKIVIGLAIMQFSGQTHRWLKGEEETMTLGKNGGGIKHDTLSRSFLNLFSWWTIFAGVEHFVGAFEDDLLYKYADTQWYLNLCELEKKVNNTCEEVLWNVTATENMACLTVPQEPANYIKYINMVEDYLVDTVCGLLDDEKEVMGQLYYWALYICSAISMWYVFDDNFLRGCDTD
ncbi:unnamed protein product [Cylindrotheca closterium]|uniref:Uncharacterized protein n=1 Tax=Cylindrotheca closterium TaxID=2856 RepID=A0AAD2CUE2_9STRA|nr:unnamed protein product [Cylindrotheca closterium]